MTMDDLPNHGVFTADASPLGLPGPSTPFRIALLGDFSGRGGRVAPKGKTRIDLAELRGRKGIRIDADEFDAAIAALAPRLTIGHGQETIELAFAALDDFDAEEIVSRTPRFRSLPTAGQPALLSTILHDPGFRALEAVWRGVDWLRRKVLREGRRVEIVLHDVTRPELAAAVNDVDDLAASPLHAWLVERSVKLHDGQPWGAVVGLHGVEIDAAAVRMLTRVAQIARRAAAPYLSEMRSPVWEKSFDPGENHGEAWNVLRRDPLAAMIGLVAPGFLIRLPYGAKGRTAGRFSYEELAVSGDDSGLLFASPALACAALLAMAYAKQGWAFRPGAEAGLSQMPAHPTRDHEGDEILVTVEVPLTQKAADALAAKGVMALQGVQGRDEVRLGRFLSLLKPHDDELAAELVGGWGPGSLERVPWTKAEPIAAPNPSAVRAVAAPLSPVSAAADQTSAQAPGSASLDQAQELAALIEELKKAPPRPGDSDWPSDDKDDEDKDDEDKDDDDKDSDDEDDADKDDDDKDSDSDSDDEDDDEDDEDDGSTDSDLAALLKQLGSDDEETPAADDDDDETHDADEDTGEENDTGDAKPPRKTRGAAGKKSAKKAMKKAAKKAAKKGAKKGAKRKKP